MANPSARRMSARASQAGPALLVGDGTATSRTAVSSKRSRFTRARTRSRSVVVGMGVDYNPDQSPHTVRIVSPVAASDPKPRPFLRVNRMRVLVDRPMSLNRRPPRSRDPLRTIRRPGSRRPYGCQIAPTRGARGHPGLPRYPSSSHRRARSQHRSPAGGLRCWAGRGRRVLSRPTGEAHPEATRPRRLEAAVGEAAVVAEAEEEEVVAAVEAVEAVVAALPR